MKLSCPACGAVASLDVLLGHEGAREAVMTALALPAPLGKLLVQYIGLFRPAQRNLSLDRVASLLGELLTMIDKGEIERGGRMWSAPQDAWAAALTEMLAKRDTLTLPLKSHGYLLTIIAGYSDKAEARKEAQTEAQRRGHTPVGAPASTRTVDEVIGKQPRAPRKPMPAHVKQALTKGGSNDGNQ
ncbi:MAG: hypothetical protein AB1722_12395 [Pseudomonadota bacterium]